MKNLKTHGFSCAGGHDGHGVAAIHERVNDHILSLSEGCVAEIMLERFVSVHAFLLGGLCRKEYSEGRRKSQMKKPRRSRLADYSRFAGL